MHGNESFEFTDIHGLTKGRDRTAQPHSRDINKSLLTLEALKYELRLSL